MIKKLLIIITACMLFSVVQAELLISVDLGAGTTVGSGTAGVVATNGWQQRTGFPDFSGAALNYADGSSSGATLDGTGSGNISSIGASTADGDYSMFNRMLGISSSLGYSTLTVSGLNIGSAYDVYVYIASADNLSNGAGGIVSTISVSDGTSTYYLEADEDTASYQGSYVQATATDSGSSVSANYVKFSGLSGNFFTISAQNIDSVTSSTAGFAGLQIVAVPEPATAGMLGLGALISMLIRHHMKA